MENDSVQKCYDENFNENIQNCNFIQRINDCKPNNPNLCPQFSPQCFCDTNGIECNNFTLFSELNLFDFDGSKLFFSPSSPAVLDYYLKLDGLQFNDDYKTDISFSNLLGIDLRTSLFKEKSPIVTLEFQTSTFDLYLSNKLVAEKDCTWELNPFIGDFSNIFSNIDILRLEGLAYSSRICPILFRNAQINKMYLLIASNENNLNFFDLSEIASQNLNSTIKELYLIYGQVYLKSTFLNKNVFENTELFAFEFDNIFGLDDDIFKSFKKIRKIQFAEGDFNGLLNNTKWLNSINSDISVNLDKQAEILAYQNRSVAIYIEGNGNWLNYSNEIFCQLKDFPHTSLVYFIIFDQNNDIECTCSVYWMIQYRYRLNVSSDILKDIQSDSVHKCYDQNFEKNVKACNFKERIEKCVSKNPLEIQLEEKNLKITELTIVSSVFGCLFGIVSLLLIFVSIKYKNAKQTLNGKTSGFSFSFKPALEDK